MLDEVAELRAAVEYDEEYDEEYMGDALVFLDPLEQDIRRLDDQVQVGDFQFGGEGLPYVEQLKTVDSRLLPFCRCWSGFTLCTAKACQRRQRPPTWASRSLHAGLGIVVVFCVPAPVGIALGYHALDAKCR